MSYTQSEGRQHIRYNNPSISDQNKKKKQYKIPLITKIRIIRINNKKDHSNDA